MNETINAYLKVLRKMPSLMEAVLDVTLEEFTYINAAAGRVERLSANVVSVGLPAYANSAVRQLHLNLRVQQRAVVHRHTFFHRRHAYRLSRLYQTHTRSGACAEVTDKCHLAELHGIKTDTGAVLEDVLATMCGSELVSMQECVSRLGQEGRFPTLCSPVTLTSLSQGLSFAVAPAWPQKLPPGLGAYVGYLYGDVMCATLQELIRLVELELLQVRNRHMRLSGRTNSGFAMTVPGGEQPPAA